MAELHGDGKTIEKLKKEKSNMAQYKTASQDART